MIVALDNVCTYPMAI